MPLDLWTRWRTAIDRANLAELDRLHDEDPNAPGGNGQTTLMLATVNGHEACMKVLLGLPGIAIDRTNDDGRTALILAAEKDQRDALRLLLAHGANPDVQDRQGRTALMHTAVLGHGGCASTLMVFHRHARAAGRPGLALGLRDTNGWSADELALTDNTRTPTFRRTLAHLLRQERLAQEREALEATFDDAPSARPSAPSRARL